jgi:hypothetical protein
MLVNLRVVYLDYSMVVCWVEYLAVWKVALSDLLTVVEKAVWKVALSDSLTVVEKAVWKDVLMVDNLVISLVE